MTPDVPDGQYSAGLGRAGKDENEGHGREGRDEDEGLGRTGQGTEEGCE